MNFFTAFTAIIFFLLPGYLIRINFYQGTLNLLDLLILFFLAAFGLSLVNKKEFINFIYFLKENFKIVLGLGLVVLGNLLSWVFGSGGLDLGDGEGIIAGPGLDIDSPGIIKSFYFLPIAFAISLSYLVKKGAIKKELILKTLFCSTSAVAALGIIYIVKFGLTYDDRLSAFYNSPNYLAMFLAPGFLIGLWLLKVNKNFKKRLFVFFILILHLIDIIYTKSSGSWLALVMSGVFLGYLMVLSKGSLNKSGSASGRVIGLGRVIIMLRKISTTKLIKFLFIVSFLITLAFFFIKPAISFLDYSPFQNRSSFDSRLVIYLTSAAIIGDNWLWGVGPGNFQNVYLDYQKFFPPYPQWAVPHPHNLFLTLWLEGGLLGLVGFLIVLLAKIGRGKTDKVTSDKKKNMGGRLKNNLTAILLLSLFVYFLIHGIIDTPFSKNDLAVIFWMSIVLD